MATILGNTSSTTITGSNLTYTYSSSDFIAGNGDTTMYPDLYSLTLSPNGAVIATGGEFNNANLSVISNDVFTFLADTLIAGNGNDTLYGDMNNLSLTATSTAAYDAVIGGVNGGTNSFTFGNNTLIAGNGNDALFGDMQNLSLTSTPANNINLDNQPYDSSAVIGQALDFNLIFNSVIGGVHGGGNSFAFGNNTLIAGDGNDALYGDMQNLNLTSNADSTNDSGLLYAEALSTLIGGFDGGGNSFVFGNNVLIDGNGNDVLYGALQDINLSVGIDSLIGGSSEGYNTFTFGTNILEAGNGTDTLYGDMQTLSLTATGSDYSFSAIGGFGSNNGSGGADNSFAFGNNILIAGNGNDVLYGTMQDLSVSETGASYIGGSGGGDNAFTVGGNALLAGNGNDALYGALQDLSITTGTVSDAESPVVGGNFNGFNSFEFAHNSLTAGNGTDLLYGDMQFLAVSAGFNSVIGGYGLNNNDFSFGSNTLATGNGHDTLYGALQDLTLSVSGPGDTLGDNVDAIAQLEGDSSGIGGIGGGNNGFAFGNNFLAAGNGSDALYGDMHDLALSVSGNENVIGGIGEGYNSFVFGNNVLHAGNGNDALYGTLENIDLSAVNGSFLGNGGGLGTNAVENYNSIVFGNNTLTAGSGNDALYADMDILTVNVDAASSINGNAIAFGVSVLNAGSGADTLVGELNEVDITGETIAQFLSQNTIIPGQTTFNLGSGVDTLVFNVGIDMGANIVNNFNSAKDILEFTNANGNTLSSVEADVKSLGSDGHGGTLVVFNAAAGDSVNSSGGSIDFTNISYHSGETLGNLVNSQAAHIVVIV